MTVLTETIPAVENPFVGPRPFTREDSPKFFGRDAEARTLVALLVSERIVLMYSPSGAGKTSLLEAKVLPELERLRFEVLPVIRVNRVPPNGLSGLRSGANRYLESVYLSLGLDSPTIPRWSSASDSDVHEINWSSLGLAGRLKLRPPRTGRRAQVLIFDQLDEVLTLDPTDDAVKEDFFRQVGLALEAPSCWALFSIREDYVAALEPYLHWLPSGLKTTFRLPLLSREAARLAVSGPIERAGLEVDEEAAEWLVGDLCRVRFQRGGRIVEDKGRYVEPVQLQVVCHRLWRKLPADIQRVTLHDIQEVQRGHEQNYVNAVLAEYYAETLRAICADPDSHVSERTLREWFDRCLITQHGLRSQVLKEFQTTGGIPNEAIQRLDRARLVRSEERNGAVWIELTHDRLIEPIKNDNDTWYEAHLQSFQLSARAWDKANRPPSLVLRNGDLEKAQAWAAAHPDELSQIEKEFLEVGQESSKKRRERVRRYMLWSIMGGLVGVIVIFFLALGSRERVLKRTRSNAMAAKAMLIAEKEPLLGLALAKKALEARPGSDQDRKECIAYDIVLELLTRSGGRKLTGHSGPISNLFITEPVVLQGHAERYIISCSSDRTALRWPLEPLIKGETIVRGTPLAKRGANGHTKPIVHADLMSWKGKQLLATASVDATARIWNIDFDTGNEPYVVTLKNGHHGTVAKVAFVLLPTKQLWICTCGVDGKVCFWRLEDSLPSLMKPWLQFEAAHKQRITALSLYTEKGEGAPARYLATASMDGTIRLWDLKRVGEATSSTEADAVSYLLAGEHRKEGTSRDLSITDLEFADSIDRPWLVSSDSGGNVRIWDIERIRQDGPRKVEAHAFSHCLSGHKQQVVDIAISSDNSLLISGGVDGRVFLWRLQSVIKLCHPNANEDKLPEEEKYRTELQGHGNSIIDIAISTKGKWIAASSEDNSVLLWRTDGILDGEKKRKAAHKITQGNRVAVVTFCEAETGINDEPRQQEMFTFLLTGCDDQSVHVWNLDDLEWEEQSLYRGEESSKRKELLRKLSVHELEDCCDQFLRRKLNEQQRKQEPESLIDLLNDK